MTAITLHRPSQPRLRVVGPAPAVTDTVRVRPARVRLTRRGRRLARTLLLVAVLAVIAGLMLALNGPLLGGTAADAGTSVSQPATRYVIVEPGQTLWQIAAQAAPHGDVRDTVARIMELNALSDSTVRPGTRIAVPTH